MADGKTDDENICGVDELEIPFGATVGHKPISTKDETRIHQVGKQMLSRFFMGFVFRRFAHRGLRKRRELVRPVFTSNGSQAPRSRTRRNAVDFRVQTDLSDSSIFPNPKAAKSPPGQSPSTIKTKKRTSRSASNKVVHPG